jgi:glycosyltransferase involved in cell wall biosynthesis
VGCALLQALDGMASGSRARWTLLVPPGTAVPPLRAIASRAVGPAGLPLHLWEQLVLPWATRNDWLLNLSGSAPWWGRRTANIVHDAAVFDRPGSYNPLFVAWYRALFRHVVRTEAVLLTVSDFSSRRLAQHLHTDAARWRVIGNGGDHLDNVVPDGAPIRAHALADRPFLLFVGSDNPAKNLGRLLEAHAALVPEIDHRLVLVGDGNAAVFRGAADRRGAAGARVVALGRVSDAQLKALYQAARAVVVPSLYEGFGLPAAEAMHQGCPVVASRTAALPEVCGDAALYIDAPHEVAALVQAMRRVLTDDALCAALRGAGDRRAAQWRWSGVAGRLQQALPVGWAA